MPHHNRLSLSLASTAAVALASLPLGITPANAAKVSQESTSSIEVIEASSNAQQFNWSVNNGQSVAQVTSVETEGRGRGRGGVPGFLKPLLEWLGFYSPSYSDPTWLLHKT